MNVYLDIQLIHHSLYDELINYSPVNYIKPKFLGDSFNKNRNIIFLINSLNLLRGALGTRSYKEFINYVVLPIVKGDQRPSLNILATSKTVDLVHGCDRLTLTNRPWVLDCEAVTAFGNMFDYSVLKNTSWKNLVEEKLKDKLCRKIMPYSEGAKKQIMDYFDLDSIENKIEVVYPAYHKIIENKNFKNNGVVKLLFVGKYFYLKGGLQMLRVFKLLRKKFGKKIELTMVTLLPDKIPPDLLNTDGLRIKSNISNSEKVIMYEEADIAVSLVFNDGMMFYLESMAYGLPIVSTNIYHLNEFVEDGRSGLLVDSPISLYGEGFLKEWVNYNQFFERVKSVDSKKFEEDVANKVSNLIDNPSTRKEMGLYGKFLVDEGKFSISQRNKKLLRIYEESIAGGNT